MVSSRPSRRTILENIRILTLLSTINNDRRWDRRHLVPEHTVNTFLNIIHILNFAYLRTRFHAHVYNRCLEFEVDT